MSISVESMLREKIAQIQEMQQHRSTDLPDSKFKRIKTDIQTVKEFLSESYKTRVESRGKSVQWDEQTRIAIDYVTLWLYSPHRDGLLLYGKYGNGKTTLLYSLKDVFSRDRASDGIILTTPAMVIRDMNNPSSNYSLYNLCCNRCSLSG